MAKGGVAQATGRIKESVIKAQIIRWLGLRSEISIFPIATTGMFDPKRNVYRKSTMRIGTPDILCCLRGKFLAIEVKAENGRLSEAQARVLEEVRQSGGYALVARSTTDVLEYFRQNNL